MMCMCLSVCVSMCACALLNDMCAACGFDTMSDLRQDPLNRAETEIGTWYIMDYVEKAGKR